MIYKPKLGLILTGGGARAAYQVGVLAAVAELLPNRQINPFPVICGTSAGAINAAALAAQADNFDAAVSGLQSTWRQLNVDNVFHTEAIRVYRSALHWLTALVVGGLGRRNPRSFLDNTPLRNLLENYIDLSKIARQIETGHLHAIGITASGYTSGHNLCFFQAHSTVKSWQRFRRHGIASSLDINHIMASVAIPALFPSVRIGGEYFGDGSMRQSTPLSHAIHMGAESLLIIGTRNDNPNPLAGPHERPPYPSLGKIGGYVLDTLFMDSLQSDAENMDRINQFINRSNESEVRADGSVLRPINFKIIVPSQDLRVVAARHTKQFPKAIQRILKGVGGLGPDTPLSSYLLFHGDYTEELMQLGYNDAMAQKDELRQFILAAPPANLSVTTPIGQARPVAQT